MEKLEELCRVMTLFGTRQWCLATSSNFSLKVEKKIYITRSGIQKSEAKEEDFLLIDSNGQVLAGEGKPSDETELHLLIYREDSEAQCVLHTHSVAGTALSRVFGDRGESTICFTSCEMQKALPPYSSHENDLALPLFQNSQDMTLLALQVAKRWPEVLPVSGFYLQGHGLYAWGSSVALAQRHCEGFEFLLKQEVMYRTLKKCF